MALQVEGVVDGGVTLLQGYANPLKRLDSSPTGHAPVLRHCRPWQLRSYRLSLGSELPENLIYRPILLYLQRLSGHDRGVRLLPRLPRC